MADSGRVGKRALKKTAKVIGWWFGIGFLLVLVGSTDNWSWWPVSVIGAVMICGAFLIGGPASLLALFGIFVGSSIAARSEVDAEEKVEREAAHKEAERLAEERETARVASITQRAALREQTSKAQQQDTIRKGLIEQLRIVTRHLEALAREPDTQRRAEIESKVAVRLQEAVALCNGLSELRALVQGSEVLKVAVREVLSRMLGLGLRNADAGALYEALGEQVVPMKLGQ